ncbi:hypothetical protein DITRI_Ditri10aG0062600 [Diplodiscus trichospermus]
MIYNHDGKGFSDIEIAVLRATGHDNGPVEDKYMHEILFLVSNSPGSIPFLAEKISCRLYKTRDRLVALKTLSLIHCLFRGGNRCFEQELRGAHVSGHLQISTHCFRKNLDSSCSFLHSYAAYLEERVGWAINQAGKLEPVMFNGVEFGYCYEKSVDMVFRKLPKCQAFIDRVLYCSPSDIVPADNLAQVAMGNTLKESFQVYFMFCEGIEILINIFFDLARPARSLACDILKRASRQSKELHNLYETCKRIIENKNLEYPCVQIISIDHVLALEHCSSFMSTASSSSVMCRTGNPTRTGKLEGENLGNRDISSSSTPFSWTLETKISKVWVVFEEDCGELELR